MGPADSPSISFMTTSDAAATPSERSHEDSMDVESVHIFDGSFIVGSENGWTVAQPGEEAWLVAFQERQPPWPGDTARLYAFRLRSGHKICH